MAWSNDSKQGKDDPSRNQAGAQDAEPGSETSSSVSRSEESSPGITVEEIVGRKLGLRLWLFIMALIVITMVVTLLAVTQPDDENYLDTLCQRNTNSSGGVVNIIYRQYGYEVECEIPEGQWKTVTTSVQR